MKSFRGNLVLLEQGREIVLEHFHGCEKTARVFDGRRDIVTKGFHGNIVHLEQG